MPLSSWFSRQPSPHVPPPAPPSIAVTTPAPMPIAQGYVVGTEMTRPASSTEALPGPSTAPPGQGPTATHGYSEPSRVQIEEVQPAPSFSGLAQLEEKELQYLQANPILLNDWIMELPEALSCVSRVGELCQRNADLANSILAKEADFDNAKQHLAKTSAGVDELRESVQQMLAQRNAIAAKQSPNLLASRFEAEAKSADILAENILVQACEGPVMSTDDLADFKQQFMQQKMEKHWRTALKEQLLRKATT